MQILEKLKNLKEKIERVQKLNEDLIESHIANKNKIKSQEMHRYYYLIIV